MIYHPKVSIIIPVYKVEKYIRECLDSIISQTFTDWECFLIDDGSRDKSGVICDEYATKDPRIRVFHKENGGVSSARNLGLDHARGEWVTFVDADDMIQPGFLSALLVPTIDYADLDFVQVGCCNYRNGKIEGIEQQYEFYVGNDPAYLFKNFRGLTVSKLFRLENVNRGSHGLPLRFDEKMRIAEDMAFTLDYILNVKRYAFVSETGYLYRRDNEGSATKSKQIIPYEIELHSFKHLYKSTIEYIKLKGLDNKECIKRYSQRGEQLQNTILSLFRNHYSFKQRFLRIKMDFSDSELEMLCYAQRNRLKNTLFLLIFRNVILFDVLTNILRFFKLIK